MLWQQPLTDPLPFRLCPDSYASSHNWGTPLRLIWEIGEIAHLGQSSILGTQEGQCGDSHLKSQVGEVETEDPWVPVTASLPESVSYRSPGKYPVSKNKTTTPNYSSLHSCPLACTCVCIYVQCSCMLITHALTQTMNIFCQNLSPVLVSRSTQDKATLYPSPQSPSSQDSCHFFSFITLPALPDMGDEN